MHSNRNAGGISRASGASEHRHACWLDASENTKPQPETQPTRITPGLPSPICGRDHQFRVAGDWALATDGLQWIVQRRRQKRGSDAWQPVSFVRSTRDVLERCLREKGAETSSIQALTAGLPDTFEQWTARSATREAAS
ncbi:MAG: hypothetical protein AB7E84_21005 [Xanthobacteraceae bacterium]